jgi:hypothetical protein
MISGVWLDIGGWMGTFALIVAERERPQWKLSIAQHCRQPAAAHEWSLTPCMAIARCMDSL